MSLYPENLSPQVFPPSPTFSAAATIADSEGSLPKCDQCRKLFQTFSREENRDVDLNFVRKDLDRPCHGWPRVAQIMTANPGFESFQAFRDLRIKSLLYYQGELDKIRQDLHKLEWDNHSNGAFSGSDSLCERIDVLFQTESKNGLDDKARDQIRLVKKMRIVLKEYSEALLQHTQINELPEAETFSVSNFLKWLQGGEDYPISGPGKNTWGPLLTHLKKQEPFWSQFRRMIRSMFWEKDSDKIHLDLVVPCKKKNVDGITRWVASEGIPFWERVCIEWRKYKEGSNDTKISEEEDPGLPPPSPENKGRRSSSVSSVTRARLWLSRLFSRNQETPEDKEVYHDAPEFISYSTERIIAFGNFIATVLACLFPIIGIVVLSRMHTQSKILGFIALFTGIFAIGLRLLSPEGTSRTEVFTATAAFSAVLVVFVQNQSSG